MRILNPLCGLAFGVVHKYAWQQYGPRRTESFSGLGRLGGFSHHTLEHRAAGGSIGHRTCPEGARGPLPAVLVSDILLCASARLLTGGFPGFDPGILLALAGLQWPGIGGSH